MRNFSIGDSAAVGMIPAAIYALQNLCIQTAYPNLSVLLFNTLNQTKVIFSAIFLYILGGKKQTVPQTIALAIMSIASVRLAYKRPAWSKRKPIESLPEDQVVRKVAESMEGWEGTKGGVEALRPKSPGSSPLLRPINMKPGKAAAETEK